MKQEQYVDLNLSLEDKKYLKFIADLGFNYCEAVKAMPEELKRIIGSYYDDDRLKKNAAKMSVNSVFGFSSRVLAILSGYTPEDRRVYLKVVKKIKKENKDKEHE